RSSADHITSRMELQAMLRYYPDLNMPRNFMVVARDAEVFLDYWNEMVTQIWAAGFTYRTFFKRITFNMAKPSAEDMEAVIEKWGKHRWTPMEYGLLLKERCRRLHGDPRLDLARADRREMEFRWKVARRDYTGWERHVQRRELIAKGDRLIRKVVENRSSWAKTLWNFRTYLRKHYTEPWKHYASTVPTQFERWQARRIDSNKIIEKPHPRRYRRWVQKMKSHA
ncbi:MAG: hypothetical protein AAF570_14290, partial [Bacteroidota bacterium]